MTKKQEEKTPAGSPGSISGTVDARQFTARLRLLAKHSERFTTIPILNYCTIEFEPLGFRMKLSHYGIDMALSASIQAEGTGAVAVPMRTLLAFVAAADGDTLTMEKVPDDSAVTFRCGRYTAQLVPLPVDDVPRLGTPDVFARGFAMGEGVLAHLFALTIPFISTEETRYYLNGVCFEFGENKVRVVATDGHKLGTRETSTPAPLEAWKYSPIVPRFAVNALAGIVGKAQCTARFHATFKPESVEKRNGKTGPEEVTIKAEWTAHCAQFSSDGWTITTKLIDGTFPDWRRVVPTPPETASKTTINKTDIGRFAKIVSGCGKGRSKAIKIAKLDGSGVRLSFNESSGLKDLGIDENGRMSAEVDADVVGEFQPIGLNGLYLDAIAKALGGDRVEMNIAGPGDPVLMRAKDGQDSAFAVLMPMRV